MQKKLYALPCAKHFTDTVILLLNIGVKIIFTLPYDCCISGKEMVRGSVGCVASQYRAGRLRAI